MSKFNVGDRVYLKADLTVTGQVVKVFDNGHYFPYRVAWDDADYEMVYAAHELVLVATSKALDAARHALAVWDGTETHVDADGFEVIGMLGRADLLADALRDLLKLHEEDK